MKPASPFFKLVELVDAEDNTIEKVRNLDLHLETDIVTSKLKSQNSFTETLDPNPEIMFTQTTDANIRKEHQFRN